MRNREITMHTLLEKLWDFHLSDQSLETEPDKIIMVEKIADTLDQLLAELNDNQRKLFHTYNDLQNEYHARTEQNAFVDGIHFAAEFLTEAVRGAK